MVAGSAGTPVLVVLLALSLLLLLLLQAARPPAATMLTAATPDINSVPFQLMKARWRQFIPEHYFFFDQSTMTRLLSDCGFKVEKTVRIGKHASAALILNRLSRYFKFMRPVEDYAGRLGISRLTVRINPLDIMLVFAVRI